MLSLKVALVAVFLHRNRTVTKQGPLFEDLEVKSKFQWRFQDIEMPSIPGHLQRRAELTSSIATHWASLFPRDVRL